MKGTLKITLGEKDKERRKSALLFLAEQVGAIGRNKEPSISYLMSLIADGAEFGGTEFCELINDALAYAGGIESE